MINPVFAHILSKKKQPCLCIHLLHTVVKLHEKSLPLSLAAAAVEEWACDVSRQLNSTKSVSRLPQRLLMRGALGNDNQIFEGTSAEAAAGFKEGG